MTSWTIICTLFTAVTQDRASWMRYFFSIIMQKIVFVIATTEMDLVPTVCVVTCWTLPFCVNTLSYVSHFYNNIVYSQFSTTSSSSHSVLFFAFSFCRCSYVPLPIAATWFHPSSSKTFHFSSILCLHVLMFFQLYQSCCNVLHFSLTTHLLTLAE